MSQGAKIEVQKFYVGKTTLFGLYFGVVIGVIMGIVSFLTLLMVNLPTSWVDWLETTIGARYDIVFSSGVFLFFVLFGLLGALIGSAVYNLVAMMHGKLEFYLMELEEENQSPEMGSV